VVARRWKLVIVAASGEDQARELAGHIRQQVPPDAVVVACQPETGFDRRTSQSDESILKSYIC
jgi:hypothetical protein